MQRTCRVEYGTIRRPRLEARACTRSKETGIEIMALNPKITIVTPSYNQAQYLEKCLSSIHDQAYTSLEHLVFDGGSSDHSLKIIDRYKERLTHWESGRDGGQSAAINKGLTMATGDILCWVNSDDGLMPGTLELVAKRLPLDDPAWIIGSAQSLSPQGGRKKLRTVDTVSMQSFMRYKEFWVPQPSVFWNRAMHERAGVLSRELNFVMDLDLFYRMYRIAEPILTPETLSFYTVHAEAKTTADPEGVDLEYASWLEQRVLNNEIEMQELLREFIRLQRGHRTISEHAVLSRIVRWWKKYINPKLYV